MKEELERVKDLITGYRKGADGNHLETMQGLLIAVGECRQYTRDNARNDRGCAQRMARELDELLASLPGLRVTVGDASSRLHNRRLAEEHIDAIVQQLESILQQEEDAKVKAMKDWVKAHPVLGKLKKRLDKSIPKGAYVLLFRKLEDGSLELVTQTANDGRVFTRFKPLEFKNELKLHSTFHETAPIVGAAVVHEKDLIAVVGTVPEPSEGGDQLKTVLAISSEAASRPAREFIELNEILKELHELSRQHKFGKDVYALLFQTPEGAEEGDLEIAVKVGDDGKILSRFWAVDFAVRHKLFEEFKNRPPVAGAALIKEKELVQIIGQVPQPAEEQDHLEALLAISWTAVEKPFVDYLSGNEVLNGLNQLANENRLPKEVEVVLFVDSGERTEILTFQDRRRTKTKIPLSEFRFPKTVYDNLVGKAPVVGASVIGEETQPVKARMPIAAGQSSREASKKPGPVSHSRLVVLAAFGRTPLKVNLVASPENLRRWGIEL